MKFNYIRPAIINKYKKQKDIIDSPTRFTIVDGSVQSGKTVALIVWLYEQSLKYKDGDIAWWVAPTYDMTKIAFTRLKRFIGHDKTDYFDYNESSLTIKLLFNNGIIRFKSGERPDNLYGESVKDIVIDEHTRIREDSYFACYSRLTATQGQMKMIGNVCGVNTWGYRLARKVEAGELPDWSYFKITSKDAVDAGVLTQDVINAAEKTYPKGVFLELFYGIPFENASNKFCYSFDERKHVGKCAVNTEYPCYLSFDFNYNPICCGIYQYYDNTIYCPEIIKLENSNIYNLCNLIKIKYPYSIFLVTGDASGASHSAMVKDNMNYYRIIKAELNLSSNQIQVPSVNPKFEENQVLVNSVLEHMNVQIDPDNAAPLIFDCKFAQIDNNGKLIKTDRNDPTQQLDNLDCFTADTLILTETGNKRIDEININEKVLTRKGYKKVIDKWDSIADVYEIELKDGTKLKCTKDHKYFVNFIGYVKILSIFAENLKVCKYQSVKTGKNIFITMGGIIMQILRNRISMYLISGVIFIKVCIDKCGMMYLVKFLKSTIFIIKMKIQKIIGLKILNLLKIQIIKDFIQLKEIRKILNHLRNGNKQVLKLLLHGIKVKQVKNGIYNMRKILNSDTSITEKINVNIAVVNLNDIQKKQDFVQTNVSLGGEDTINQIKKLQSVSLAEKNLKRLNICPIYIAQNNADQLLILKELGIKDIKHLGKQKVFDITVEDSHEFFANNILVHNCFRYYLNQYHKNILKIQKSNLLLPTENY